MSLPISHDDLVLPIERLMKEARDPDRAPKAQQGGNTYISRLPAEVLTEIFACVVHDRDIWPRQGHYPTCRTFDEYPYFKKELFILLHVCSYWRDFVLHTPCLWARFSMNLFGNVIKKIVAVRLFLSLSGSCPLAFALYYHTRDPDENHPYMHTSLYMPYFFVMLELIEHRGRWKHVLWSIPSGNDVQTTMDVIFPSEADELVALPQLESLIIQRAESHPSHWQFTVMKDSYGFLNATQFPKLRQLLIQNKFIGYNCKDSPPLVDLQHCFISLKGSIFSLLSSPHLETFRAGLTCAGTGRGLGRVAHHNLTELGVVIYPNSNLHPNDIFHSLTLPSLKRFGLAISSYSNPSGSTKKFALADFFQRSFPNQSTAPLQELVLRFGILDPPIEVEPSDLIDALRHVPNLKRLVVFGVPLSLPISESLKRQSTVSLVSQPRANGMNDAPRHSHCCPDLEEFRWLPNERTAKIFGNSSSPDSLNTDKASAHGMLITRGVSFHDPNLFQFSDQQCFFRLYEAQVGDNQCRCFFSRTIYLDPGSNDSL